MNRMLLRGLERSSGALQAGWRRPFSTNPLAAATASRGPNYLMARQRMDSDCRRHRFPAPAPLTYRPRGSNSDPGGNISHMSCHFSSVATNAVTSGSDGQAHLSAVVNAPDRPPSALERANLTEITPGHALSVLQIYAAQPTNLIRHSDFVKLCESARPGKGRDGKIIATALREFRRNNRFNIHIVGASAAIEGMLRALIPQWKVQDGRPRLRAATFVAQQIADEKTGLYFAVETVMINKVLEEINKGLTEMVENGFDVRVGDLEKSEEKSEEGGESEESEEGSGGNPDDKTLRDAFQATEEIINLLTRRCSCPEQQMKKRARRVYLKKLRVKTGPKMTTYQSAANIAVMIGGADAAREKIKLPVWWCEKDHARLGQMIDEAAAKVTAQDGEGIAPAAEAAEEPPAAEESEGEGVEEVEEESDESVEDGDDAADEAGETPAESAPDEEKKD